MKKIFLFSFLLLASFIVIPHAEARHHCRSRSTISFGFGQQISHVPQVVYCAPAYPVMVSSYPVAYPVYMMPASPVYYYPPVRSTSTFQWGFSHRF